MDDFFDRLIIRAATTDELLSKDFEVLRGQKSDTDQAARRLASWCRACASGDWSLFGRRLQRDGLSYTEVLARFATVERSVLAATPVWAKDAIWIEFALRDASNYRSRHVLPEPLEQCAFEDLFFAVAEQAETRLWSGLSSGISDHLSAGAHAGLRTRLVRGLSALCAPALYERFAKARDAERRYLEREQKVGNSLLYDGFIAELRAGGLRKLFEDKPVLLRLIAVITKQWIDTSRQFVQRLDSDLDAICREIIHSSQRSRVAAIEGDLSDPHNNGYSVQIITFEDGSRVVYKPKDLRVDAAWQLLVNNLNEAGSPVQLKTVKTVVRSGYGWTEFVEHVGCSDAAGLRRYFARAGAWLALFHCFAGSDLHQENIIAAGDHPVPIDLEMILQAIPQEEESNKPEAQAFFAAAEMVTNSVMMVGLLPTYDKSPDNKVFAVGGMISDWTERTAVTWNDINTDAMRPSKVTTTWNTVPNLPHIGGRYAKLGDHIEEFVIGFQDYAKFLMRVSRDMGNSALFDGFRGLPVRKIIRPTRFYYMLLQRLRNHRAMDDGVVWSAQADFLARLSDWETDSDVLWPLQRAERSALLQLNVPHFVSPSDDGNVADALGTSVRTATMSGVERARARVWALDEKEIARQVDVVRQNTELLSRPMAVVDSKAARTLNYSTISETPMGERFVREADKAANDLTRYAVRRGLGAAWIGLDWLGDSDVAQLVTLGPDLYNGHAGIAVFFAAHAAVTRNSFSKDLATAAVAHLRGNLRGRNAARTARLLGIGGTVGLGSIIYAFAVMAKCLRDDELLSDAHLAASLFTDDLIGADAQLDVMGGSAGAILCLLRLYRDSKSRDVLMRAAKCGEHLLAQPRHGAHGYRSWIGLGTAGSKPLNGMSHGAAGYAYALASLAAATGREDFASAAVECLAYEDSNYDVEHTNWPEFNFDGKPAFPCQWCHGALGIGLARIGIFKRGMLDANADWNVSTSVLKKDIARAVAGAEAGWPGHVDTMCCGTLGSVEFFSEASGILDRTDLRGSGARRLAAVLETVAMTDDYRWNTGIRQYNPGLFRGLAGVGYTCLRQIDPCLPNILIWE